MKTFKYSISIEAIDSDKEPRSMFADEILHELFSDAINHCNRIIELAFSNNCNGNNKEFISYMEAKIKTYTLMMGSTAKID